MPPMRYCVGPPLPAAHGSAIDAEAWRGRAERAGARGAVETGGRSFSEPILTFSHVRDTISKIEWFAGDLYGG
jgi:hypothetical protein